MIKINKGTEPIEWCNYRQNPGADYMNAPKEAKLALRESLLEEQGYICAYCESRIPIQNAPTEVSSKIEHILPRSSNSIHSRVDYNNMVVCCPGNTMGNIHCDSSKGNNEIHFDLFSDNIECRVKYKLDGTICPQDDQDILMKEDIEVLNLNLPILKENRKNVLEGISEMLGKKEWNQSELRDILSKYENKTAINKYNKKHSYYPFCGIARYFLKKRIKKM